MTDALTIDQVQRGALPVADWYPDPSGASQLRWWGGLAWTEHVKPMEAPQPVWAQAPGAPAFESPSYLGSNSSGLAYVPFAHDSHARTFTAAPMQTANTAAIWILAVTPLLTVVLQFFVVGVGPGPSTLVLLGAQLLQLAIFVALVLWDRAALRALTLSPTSLWWFLLPSPIVYLIVRRLSLRRQGVISNAPSNVFVLVLLASAALVYPLVASQLG